MASSSTTDFGELVLVLGDMHIPHRESAIPEKFRRMLVPNKMQHVLCTGNLVTQEQYDDLRSLAPNVHVVRGDFDDASANYPDTKVVTIGQIKIGLCHGHQVVPWGDLDSLGMLQRQLDVDILVTGHTHRDQYAEADGALLVNPGSITGAYSGLELPPGAGGEVAPSFMLLAVQGAKVVVYIYKLDEKDEIHIDKKEYIKEGNTF
mmetsp:Transcript_3264/g.4581  ORF Transcript_3264/g.4581 Transcript_3264/m.4581 type:complete len:205 (+) Transcript_3264:42-656(+)